MRTNLGHGDRSIVRRIWYIGMLERGEYGSELLNNFIYWPTETNGYRINDHCEPKTNV